MCFAKFLDVRERVEVKQWQGVDAYQKVGTCPSPLI